MYDDRSGDPPAGAVSCRAGTQAGMTAGGVAYQLGISGHCTCKLRAPVTVIELLRERWLGCL